MAETNLALGIGALIAAEATGVTNFSGGGDVSVQVPTKEPGSPIPSPSTPEPSVITPTIEVPESGLDGEALAAVMEANQPEQTGIDAEAIAEIVNANQTVEGFAPDEVAQLLEQVGEKADDVPKSPEEVADKAGEKTADEIERRVKKKIEEKKKEIKEKTPDSDDSKGGGSGGESHDSRSEWAGDAVSDFIWGAAKDPATRLDEETWLDGGGVDNAKDVGNAVKEVGAKGLDWLIPGDHSDEVTTDPGGKVDEGPLTDNSPTEVAQGTADFINQQRQRFNNHTSTGSSGVNNTDTTGDGEDDTYLPEGLGSGFA